MKRTFVLAGGMDSTLVVASTIAAALPNEDRVRFKRFHGSKIVDR